MIIGVVKEIHHGERRVAMAPSVVKQFIKTGHSVLVEHDAGVIANFTDEQYKDSGAEILKNAENVCIWGASGKGVLVLSEFSEELLEKVKFVIDINPKKQGKYLPLSGKLVTSPNILKYQKGQFFIIIMNEIYQDEIKKNINSMGVDAIFINSTFGSL